MAKLSAGGRTELARVAREVDFSVAENDLIDWQRITYALMNDGKVLCKRDVRFRSEFRDGGKHSHGWTVVDKLGLRTLDGAESWVARLESAGYKRVSSRGAK
jgi:hypothetical protein